MIGGYNYYNLDDFDDVNNWRSNASYFEIYDPATENWSDLKRNPFFPERTTYYWQGTSVTKEDSFLIFGGAVGFYYGKELFIKITF